MSVHTLIMEYYKDKEMKMKEVQEIRLREIRNNHPHIEEIEFTIKQNDFKMMQLMMSGNHSKLESFLNIQDDLKKEKARLLIEAGYPEDYLEVAYECEKCKDKGYIGTEKCTCYFKVREIIMSKKANFRKDLAHVDFSTFDLSLYSNKDIVGEGISALSLVKTNIVAINKLLKNANESPVNLLITGGKGCGKSYLATCIGKEFLKKDNEVLYIESRHLFKYWAMKPSEMSDSAKRIIGRLSEIDCLIIDDLGLEKLEYKGVSNLFELINSRERLQKHTIIVCKYNLEHLGDRYSPQIQSRLMWGYDHFEFKGMNLEHALLEQYS